LPHHQSPAGPGPPSWRPSPRGRFHHRHPFGRGGDHSFVGSPLSVNALREDLLVSHKTVAGWLRVLERLYAVFRLPPFGSPKIRAVKKEEKHYHYFRDTDGREVDFVVVEGRLPILLVEAKWGDAEPDKSLRYLKTRFPDADAWQVSAAGRKDFVTPEGIRVAPALELLSSLV